jgi:hypothetical protein
MWRRVDILLTDVSEEGIASIFGEEKSTSEEPAWAGDCRLPVRYVPPKRRFTQDLHGPTSQNTAFFRNISSSYLKLEPNYSVPQPLRILRKQRDKRAEKYKINEEEEK